MRSDSPFISPVAVEAWDACFRWRDHGRLGDLTIDTTWDRVASCLTGDGTGTAREDYRRRLLHAFGGWRLLLDERILTTAGTSRCVWPDDGLAAALNVARFVKAPCTPRAEFDRAAFEETADLAVRALDDATLVVRAPKPTVPAHLRIGMLGVADALALLGIAYDSPEALAQTAIFAQALAHGCLHGSVAMARERGARMSCPQAWEVRERSRQTPPELIAEAVRSGLRHDGLTALTSQQHLAWLANDVSDALDPLRARACAYEFACGNGRRCVQSEGYARIVARQLGASRNDALLGPVSVSAQLRLRAVAQAWIDEPISYPVRVETQPDADAIVGYRALADELTLGKFAWRLCNSEPAGNKLAAARMQ
jgi:ribonucleoside-diphosphate reductase alpha chain